MLVKEALRLFLSNLDESNILLEGRIAEWIDTVNQFFTDIAGRGGHRQIMYADHYGKNPLENIFQLLGTIRWLIQYLETDKLNIIEEHRNIKENHYNVVQLDLNISWLSKVPSSDQYLSQ